MLCPQQLAYRLFLLSLCKGVLIYEMLVGVAPFHALDPMSTYESILACKVPVPATFSKVRHHATVELGRRTYSRYMKYLLFAAL